MNSLTDPQLLRDYTERRSEAAFAELVRRHVDLVYSAALRMVRDAHLAEDVTQGVFVALAQNARQLANRPVLSGWLHRTAQNFAANAVRSDVRRRAREQEAAAMNELLAPEPDAVWEHIAPHLDAALGELSEPDRDALLLRYFERKSAREMAQTLGLSEDAAQKRVSRAVERLREFFAKRGVTIGASGLAVAITANAVQAAPVGLAITISAAAALAGTSLATTAIAATKAIAMTTLQKAFVTATFAVLAGAGIYEARQASIARTEVQILKQQQAPLTEQTQQLTRERDELTNRLAALVEENERLNRNTAELLRLRSEIGSLHQQAGESDKLREESRRLQTQLEDSKDPSRLLGPDDRTELHHMHIILAMKRVILGMKLYAGDHDGRFPTTLDELKPSPYLETEGTNFTNFKFTYVKGIPDEIGLDAFELVNVGRVNDGQPRAVVIRERIPRPGVAGETSRRCYGFADLKVQCTNADMQGNFAEAERRLGVLP